MSVAFDNTFLTLLLNPKSEARDNPDTGEPTPHVRERIDSLLDELAKSGETLIIPAPCVAEVLCKIQKTSEFNTKISSYSCIDVFPFDQKCAVELSDFLKANPTVPKAVAKEFNSTWQAVKMDLLIVCVAKVNGATIFYTDDDTQSRFATLCGLHVKHTWDLPISAERAQRNLDEKEEEWPDQKKPTKPNDSSK